MNTVRKMKPTESIYNVIESKRNLSLVNTENLEDKKEAETMTKDYLNEKLSYFYSHGGPIMDL